jgi:hypothetical protein
MQARSWPKLHTTTRQDVLNWGCPEERVLQMERANLSYEEMLYILNHEAAYSFALQLNRR